MLLSTAPVMRMRGFWTRGRITSAWPCARLLAWAERRMLSRGRMWRSGLAVFLLLAGFATAGVSSARASTRDLATTEAYVEADFKLMRGAVDRIPIAEAALRNVLGGVRSGCPGAAAGSPQDPMSTQLSNEVIGALVLAVVDRGLPLARAFVRSTAGLRWSDARLTSEVQHYVADVRTLSALATPALCEDVRAWAASGFQTLTARTEAFDARFMPAWVAAGDLPAALSRFENQATRAMARRAASLEAEFGDFEARAVETWGKTMNALELWP